MRAITDEKNENPGLVLPGWKSQKVGPHWFRTSLRRQYLQAVRSYCSIFFGDSVGSSRGYNSFDIQYVWSNGVTFNYDLTVEKSNEQHGGYVSLDIPGHVLDGMSDVDLRSFLFGLRKYEPKVTRFDIFYDDYQRLVTPSKIHNIIKKGDFSRFRKSQITQVFKEGELVYNEVNFGNRGSNGSGKYMRIYDKAMESNNRQDCIRYEVELSGKRAQMAYDLLTQMGSVESMASLYAELVVGAICFVHRTGDRNIGRLKVYRFWERIKKNLSSVVLRIPVKHITIESMFKFIEKQAIRTIAVLRGTFVSDVDFFNWQATRLYEAELCLNPHQRNLIKENRRKTRFDDGLIFDY